MAVVWCVKRRTICRTTCRKNGEKCCFKNIAEAAKDANISAPALRRRILTDVHVNNYHWIFDKNATHYS